MGVTVLLSGMKAELTCPLPLSPNSTDLAGVAVRQYYLTPAFPHSLLRLRFFPAKSLLNQLFGCFLTVPLISMLQLLTLTQISLVQKFYLLGIGGPSKFSNGLASFTDPCRHSRVMTEVVPNSLRCRL